MTNDQWERLKTLLEDALTLQDGRRRTFVAKVRAADKDLGDKLSVLLADHKKAGRFLGGQEDEKEVFGPRKLIARRYELIQRLGRGGMGEVYRARDRTLEREVALKFLVARQRHAVSRFVREARAASALNHPNIVTIYDAGKTGQVHFIVMEFVSGRTLRRSIGQPLPAGALIDLGIQMSKALGAAHAAGIIHRDIKPENIMVRDDGSLKILDFGLARWEPDETKPRSSQTITAPNILLGTLRYLSPEQLKRQSAKTASDIFSLGIVLYELACGQYPFAAESETEILQAIESRVPIPPSRLKSDIDPALENVILRMLDKDHHCRPSAVEVENVLSARLSGGRMPELPSVARTRRRMVGRHRERAELQVSFEKAVRGNATLVSIGGEPGIGKTTLVEDFLDEIQDGIHNCIIGRGRSSERLAGTEAYLPFLEILEDLIQGDDDGSVVQLLKELAPDWRLQVSVDTTLSNELQAREVKPVSRERLKRQIVNFFGQVSRRRPLVLFFDDIHWADASTVEFLAYLAFQFDSMRVLMLATYRPHELVLAGHPFVQMKLELQRRNLCSDLHLDFLTQEDVAAYLELEFQNHRFPHTFCALIHSQSEGNPFFMVDMLRYLRDRKAIIEKKGVWLLEESLPDIQVELPQSIRGMIQRKIDLLTDPDRRLLAAASVQGYEFDSAVMAKTLAMDPADVEDHLDSLDQVHAFVRLVRKQEFTDRTLTLRYRFVHVLYQNAFFAMLRPTRKASLSGAIASALMAFHGDQHTEIASELAALFESARDFSRAAGYFLIAARKAADVFAYEEAALLARRTITVVESLPDTPERVRLELEAQLTLGLSLLSLKGYGNPEVQQIYGRARQLCLQAGENPSLFPVLWGLVAYYAARLELETASELANQLLRLANPTRDANVLVIAHLAAGIVTFLLGQLTQALEHLQQYRTLDDPAQRRQRSLRYSLEPGILLRGFEARLLWFKGYPDRSLSGVQESLKIARELNHPPTLAFIMAFVALVRQMRGEVAETLQIAEELVELGKQHDLVIWIAEGSFFKGWVLTQGNKTREGIDLMRQGLSGYRATGTELLRPYFQAVLAETLAEHGRAAEGLELILDVSSFSNTYFGADLLRIRGLLSPTQGKTGGEPFILESLRISREQGAKSFELRAAIALKKLCPAGRKSAAASRTLSEVYASFSEGFDTADLRDARKLIGAQARASRSRS